MKRIFMLFLVMAALYLSGGCVSRMIANALVPGPDPRPKQRELTFNENVNKEQLKTIAFMVKDTDGKPIENNALKKLALKAIDKEGKRAHGAGQPSALAMVGNQVLSNTTRPMVEEGIRSGFELTKSAVARAGVDGGLVAMLIGLARSRKRKVRTIGMFKTEASEDEMTKFRKAAAHTGLEKEVG
jgi:hypothetical protein